MVKEINLAQRPHADKGLVAMFLRMSPEERLQANDNMVRTILELRQGYRQWKANERRSKRNS